MGRDAIYKMIWILLLIGALSSVSYGQEIRTHYASVIYQDESQVTRFNEISLSSFPPSIRAGQIVTSHDELGDKLDRVVQRVETILNIFPFNLKFRVVLLPTARDVQAVYRTKYGMSAEYVAFYSPEDKTAFISVDDVNLNILAHELTHVVLDHYFLQPPPAVIQELVARYVDFHIDD